MKIHIYVYRYNYEYMKYVYETKLHCMRLSTMF